MRGSEALSVMPLGCDSVSGWRADACAPTRLAADRVAQATRAESGGRWPVPPGELALLTDVSGADPQTVGHVASSALT